MKISTINIAGKAALGWAGDYSISENMAMIIVQEESKGLLNFSTYKQEFEKRINTDSRERIFQDLIILPFLTELLRGYDVIPTDQRTSAQKSHATKQYCGSTNPDLCIAKNWHWFNNEHSVIYMSVVEIKSPLNKTDRITGVNPGDYNQELKAQIQTYALAENNKKLILTDGLTWVFYTFEKDLNGNPRAEPAENFDRINLGSIKTFENGEYCINWLSGTPITAVDDEVIRDMFDGPLPPIEKDPKVFTKLKRQILEFIENEVG